MLQEFCRMKCHWDDPVLQALQLQWRKWLADLKRVADFKVSRCFKPKNFRQPTSVQLHHFSDASQGGYGTVIYTRMQNGESIHVAFVLGKARLVPLKQMTIPCMELTAAVLVVQVDKMLQDELQLKMEKSVFWTDSPSVHK